MACCLEGTPDSKRKMRRWELEGRYPQEEQNEHLELAVDRKQSR